MTHFKIQNIVFDTRTLDCHVDNKRLAKKLQRKWLGKTLRYSDNDLKVGGIADNLDTLMNFVIDETNWLCYTIELKSLDIAVPEVLEYLDEWGAPEIPGYPLRRSTRIKVS